MHCICFIFFLFVSEIKHPDKGYLKEEGLNLACSCRGHSSWMGSQGGGAGGRWSYHSHFQKADARCCPAHFLHCAFRIPHRKRCPPQQAGFPTSVKYIGAITLGPPPRRLQILSVWQWATTASHKRRLETMQLPWSLPRWQCYRIMSHCHCEIQAP